MIFRFHFSKEHTHPCSLVELGTTLQTMDTVLAVLMQMLSVVSTILLSSKVNVLVDLVR